MNPLNTGQIIAVICLLTTLLGLGFGLGWMFRGAREAWRMRHFNAHVNRMADEVQRGFGRLDREP